MSSALSHIGSVAARFSPENSNIKIADGTGTASLVYLGALSNLKTQAAALTIGAAFGVPSDFGITNASFTVSSIELAGGPGNTGRLTVGVFSPSVEGSSGQQTSDQNVEWQLEWTLVERRIELHPTFAPLFDPTDGSFALAAINKWKNLADEYADRKAAFEIPDNPENPTTWTALSGLARTFCEKLAKGIEAYQVQVPVVRKTLYRTFGPTSTDGSTCGQREDPPRFSGVAAAWLKTADSWTKSGQSKWEHRQEWSGFDSLDDDLYPPAAEPDTDSSSS